MKWNMTDKTKFGKALPLPSWPQPPTELEQILSGELLPIVDIVALVSSGVCARMAYHSLSDYDGPQVMDYVMMALPVLYVVSRGVQLMAEELRRKST